MNEEEILKALEIIKQPIEVHCDEYKCFDTENYNKLISVYDNCLWFIRNFEQINYTVERCQKENKHLLELQKNMDKQYAELETKMQELIKYLEDKIKEYKDYLKFLKIKLSNAVVYGEERSIEDKIQINEIGLRIYQEILSKVKENK